MSDPKCMDCGESYGSPRFPDLVLPNEVWNKLIPDGGLLCPNCLCARAHEAGITCTATFRSGPFFASPTPSLPEDAARVVERLRQQSKLGPTNVSRAMMRDGADLIEVQAARIQSLSSQLAEMRMERDQAILYGDGQRYRASNAEADRDRLAAELDRLREIMGRVPAALNSHFSAGMEEREGGSARRQEKLMKYGEDLLSALASLEDRA